MVGARPFRLWEDEYMRDFILKVSEGAYTPPNRRIIGGELLDYHYESLKARIDTLIRGQETLNFVLDESPDISSRRVINLSIVVPSYGSIYLSNEDVGREDLDTSYFTN